MQNKVLPVIRFEIVAGIKNGLAVTEEGNYYSATALSALGGHFPGSRAGVYKMADREAWEYINLPGKGAKEGVKYFKLPDELTVNLTHREDFSADLAKQDARIYKPLKKAVPDGAIEIEYYPGVNPQAGAGQVTPTDQVVVNLTINAADWNRYVGLDSQYVKLVKVFGDSMKPVLNHGDQTLVDTACKQFIDDAIYCIAQGELLRFKRIKLQLDGKVIVKSDNEIEGFPPEIYTAEEAANFHVIGRVIPLKFGWFEI